MKSYLALSSESSSQSDFCRQCQILQQENNRLRAKYEKTHEKYHTLKHDYEELILQKQLLEEQVKLLEATKSTPMKQNPQSENGIPASKVSSILEDFDSILSIQSEEINKLMEDRDKLSSTCFRCLGIINKQESTLSKFQNALKKLTEFASAGEVSSESVKQEFHSLGCDISSVLSAAQRRANIEGMNELLASINAPQIDQNEVLRILSEIPNAPFDNESLQTVTEFVIQQISKQKKTILELQDERDKTRSLKSKLQTLLSSIKSDRISVKDGVAEVSRLKKGAARGSQAQSQLQRIVGVMTSFGERFPESADTERCLSRIRAWEDDTQTGVDVVQEIDFLLGLCVPTTVTIEVEKEMPKPETPQVDKEMIMQIRELKKAVGEMKQQIRNNESERQSFITAHCKKSLPLTAKWSQICEYLLSK